MVTKRYKRRIRRGSDLKLRPRIFDIPTRVRGWNTGVFRYAKPPHALVAGDRDYHTRTSNSEITRHNENNYFFRVGAYTPSLFLRN